jgi:hypothetical protein
MLLLSLLMGAAGATAAGSAAAALPILMRSQWERLPPPGVMQHCSLLVAKGGQQAVWQRDVAKLLQVRVDLRVLKQQRGMRMFHCTNEFQVAEVFSSNNASD